MTPAPLPTAYGSGVDRPTQIQKLRRTQARTLKGSWRDLTAVTDDWNCWGQDCFQLWQSEGQQLWRLVPQLQR